MKYTLAIFTFCAFVYTSFGQNKTVPTKPNVMKFGALAVDRANGFIYGWSFDQDYQNEAEKRALEECKKRGGNCSIVLTYSGEGCAAYRTLKTTEGTAYGWGVAKTKQEADAIAVAECKKRSKGKMPTNFVWSCNSTTSAPLKEIFNAKEEFSGVEITKLPSSKSLCFSSDGTRLFVGGDDRKLRIMSMPDFKLIRIINVGGTIEEVAVSPDNKLVAIGHGRGGKPELWDVATGQLVRTLPNEWYGNAAFSFSPDGKLFASQGDCNWSGKSCPGKIYLWETATGKLIREMSGHERNISSSSFSMDGKILATTAGDGTVCFWDVANGSKIGSFLTGPPDQYGNNGLSMGLFSPDGKTYVSQSWDGDRKMKVWDVQSRRNLLTLAGHGKYGESMSFFGGAKRLVSTGMNDTMILWDLETGAKIASASDVPYWTIAVSPNGTIATGGAQGVNIYKFEGGNFQLVKKFDIL